MANEQLDDFNHHAAAQHAALSGRFSQHVHILNTVQADLMAVFQRIRAVKQKLLQEHPELQAAAEAKARERSEELDRT